MIKTVARILLAVIQYAAMGVVIMIYIFKKEADIGLLLTWLLAGFIFVLLFEEGVLSKKKRKS
jgi:hypothetical protein